MAPITTFWSWTLSFALFLSVFTFVLLIRTPARPTYFEWYLLAYVLGFLFELIRKVRARAVSLCKRIELGAWCLVVHVGAEDVQGEDRLLPHQLLERAHHRRRAHVHPRLCLTLRSGDKVSR